MSAKDNTVKTYDATQPRPTGVQLTPAAIAHVTQALAKRGKGCGLRIGVKTTGCSGYQYVVDFVDAPECDDHVFSQTSSWSVYIDPKSYPLIQGLVVDFKRQGLNETFIYRNPNQTGECGCGESFAV